MNEVFHYLKSRLTNEDGRVELIAWCGVEYPNTKDRNSFTQQVSHATCEACKEEAALFALAKVP